MGISCASFRSWVEVTINVYKSIGEQLYLRIWSEQKKTFKGTVISNPVI